jgi:hypothetical protein
MTVGEGDEGLIIDAIVGRAVTVRELGSVTFGVTLLDTQPKSATIMTS